LEVRDDSGTGEVDTSRADAATGGADAAAADAAAADGPVVDTPAVEAPVTPDSMPYDSADRAGEDRPREVDTRPAVDVYAPPPDLGPTCTAGEQLCSGHCAHVADDAQNCGQCDHRCGFSDTCASGSCRKKTTANLIQNPGAEQGTASWTAVGGAVVRMYGQAGVPAATDPGPPARGQQLFAGPPLGQLTQDLDLGVYAAAIDAGRVTAHFGAYLGGIGTSVDGASITILFTGQGGGLINAPYINGPNNAARSNQTRLDPFSMDVAVPAGTRGVTVRLSMFGNDTAYGVADELELTLTGI